VALICVGLFQRICPLGGAPVKSFASASYKNILLDTPLTPLVADDPLVPLVPAVAELPLVPLLAELPLDPEVPELPSPPLAPSKFTVHDE
jgi:hypothetical protein